MSTSFALIAACALTTAVFKALGPVALGGRRLPARLGGVVVLLAPALLGALVVTQALAEEQRLTVGANSAGVATAGLLAWRGASILVCLFAAAAVTAGLRAIAAGAM
jgi:branched-subunit amino acid transport protein